MSVPESDGPQGNSRVVVGSRPGTFPGVWRPNRAHPRSMSAEQQDALDANLRQFPLDFNADVATLRAGFDERDGAGPGA